MRRLAHGRRGRHTGVVTLGLVFGTAVAALVVARVFDLGVAATLVTMLVGGGAPAALYLAWATYRDSRSEGTPLTLAGIADQLAVAVAAQWEAEAGVRRLNDPYPLSVSWEAESVNLCDAPGRGFYRVVASVFWGGLIQELAGISGGSGGLLTKRSGWAA